MRTQVERVTGVRAAVDVAAHLAPVTHHEAPQRPVAAPDRECARAIPLEVRQAADHTLDIRAHARHRGCRHSRRQSRAPRGGSCRAGAARAGAAAPGCSGWRYRRRTAASPWRATRIPTGPRVSCRRGRRAMRRARTGSRCTSGSSGRRGTRCSPSPGPRAPGCRVRWRRRAREASACEWWRAARSRCSTASSAGSR